MGRPSDKLDPDQPYKFHLIRLKWVDGDYDQGGAYWGNSGGTSIYWAYDDEVQVFVRAASRDRAKQQILEKAPQAKFYR